MAINCENILTADIQRDCNNNPVAGLEVNVLIFNLADVDKSSVTFDTTTDLKMTNFQLKTGKTAYLLDGVKSNTFSFAFELVKSDYANSYKHTFSGVIVNPTVENKKAVEILAGGGKFGVILEKKWKGQNSGNAFEVLGYDNGLEGSTLTYNSKENNGTILFELASEEGMEEPRLPYTLIETDYATTKTAFDNKFTQV